MPKWEHETQLTATYPFVATVVVRGIVIIIMRINTQLKALKTSIINWEIVLQFVIFFTFIA